MAYRITEECNNYGACFPECPSDAIYEAGSKCDMNGQTYGEGDPVPSGATGFYSDQYYLLYCS